MQLCADRVYPYVVPTIDAKGEALMYQEMPFEMLAAYQVPGTFVSLPETTKIRGAYAPIKSRTITHESTKGAELRRQHLVAGCRATTDRPDDRRSTETAADGAIHEASGRPKQIPTDPKSDHGRSGGRQKLCPVDVARCCAGVTAACWCCW